MTIKRHNHYVPELYLANWAEEKKIYSYRLLAPHEKMPNWSRQSIENTASINNLYVRQELNAELDDFEDLFNHDYETSVKMPLLKAYDDQKMTPEDWYILIEFLSAQIVRTPAFYFRTKEMTKEMMPEILDDIGEKLSKLTPEKIHDHSVCQAEDNLLPLNLEFSKVSDKSKKNGVTIKTVVGKSTWLFAMKHLLTSTCKVFHQYKWSIITAADEISWPTSDDPVLCIYNNGDGHYSFNGGWGVPGTEFIMPIGPRKALYTQVGKKYPPRMKLDIHESFLIKKLIVAHAFMYIYSDTADNTIPQLRPRVINLDEFKRINDEYENWYDVYQKNEVPYLELHIIRPDQ